MSNRSTTVLTEESVADLSKRFGSTVSTEPGLIVIPRRALTSSEEDGSFVVPRDLNSIATLRFLGLSKLGADRTWNRYKDFLDTRYDDIIDFALGTVKSGDDTISLDDEDWVVAMKSMGIGKDLRRRILTPSYKSIRITKTPQEWILQTITESLDDIVQHGPDKPPGRFVTLQDRSVAVDEVQLYQGGSYKRMMTGFRTSNDGTRQNVTLRLASAPPTDFSRGLECTYWTQNLEIAEQYAGWARCRNNLEDMRTGILEMRTGIMNMILPKTIFELATQFHNREHWQEFIWVNALDLDIPDHLDYLDSAEALVGPILSEARAGVGRNHKAGGHWSSLDAQKLTSGSKGMQVMFKGQRIHSRLDSEARLWIDLWTNPSMC
ncbi:hypothetical protein BDR22DRAFT_822549 [Usnea florida]